MPSQHSVYAATGCAARGRPSADRRFGVAENSTGHAGDRAQIVEFCVSGIGRLAREEDRGVRDGVGCAAVTRRRASASTAWSC
jgi:hypothetical protein